MTRISRRKLTHGAAFGFVRAVAAPALAQSDKRRWSRRGNLLAVIGSAKPGVVTSVGV